MTSRLAVKINAKKAVKAAQYKVRSQARFAVAAAVWGKMNLALNAVMANTPAWTGDTVANYVWGIGSASGQYSGAANFNWRNPRYPVEDRTPHEARSRANLNAMRSEVFKDPYRHFVLWNNSEYEDGMDIKDLEYGTLTGTPALMFNAAKAVLAAKG